MRSSTINSSGEAAKDKQEFFDWWNQRLCYFRSKVYFVLRYTLVARCR